MAADLVAADMETLVEAMEDMETEASNPVSDIAAAVVVAMTATAVWIAIVWVLHRERTTDRLEVVAEAGTTTQLLLVMDITTKLGVIEECFRKTESVLSSLLPNPLSFLLKIS